MQDLVLTDISFFTWYFQSGREKFIPRISETKKESISDFPEIGDIIMLKYRPHDQEAFHRAVHLNAPVYLVGPSGIGKTHLLKLISTATGRRYLGIDGRPVQAGQYNYHLALQTRDQLPAQFLRNSVTRVMTEQVTKIRRDRPLIHAKM